MSKDSEWNLALEHAARLAEEAAEAAHELRRREFAAGNMLVADLYTAGVNYSRRIGAEILKLRRPAQAPRTIHYYYCYQVTDHHGRNYNGNALVAFPGPFDLAYLHKLLANQYKATAVVTYWKRISRAEAERFARYCDEVRGGMTLPKIVKLAPAPNPPQESPPK